MEICHQVHSARITSIKYREQIPLNTTKIGFSGSPKHFSLFFSFFLTLLINQLHQRNSNHLITNSISVPVLMREKKSFLCDIITEGTCLPPVLPLFRLPLPGTTFLLTSGTAVASHISELLLQPLALTVQNVSYNRPPYIRQSSSLSQFRNALTTFVFTSDRAVPSTSHSSKLHLQPFNLHPTQ